MHAFSRARARTTVRVGDLGCRAASARARLAWRFQRGREATAGLAGPALASVGVAGLVFLGLETLWGALAAGGWTFAVALLLALRSAQQRNAQAAQQELYELRQAMQHELYELRQQLHVTQALIQVDELEDAEELDPHDEPTRAGPAPKPPRLGWGRRLGLSWPSSR